MSASPDSGGRWWLPLVLLIITSLVATAAILNERWMTRASVAMQAEGLYWTVSQYQVAHHRLKQELRAVAAGELADIPALSRWAAVAASKASILTEPSEFRAVVIDVPGYLAATQQLAALQQDIGPVLDRSPFAKADAGSVLSRMSAIDDDELLGRLSSAARLADVRMKEQTLRELALRLRWLWAALATCLLVLAMWLLYAVQSRRRYAAVALERQSAVDAMDRVLIDQRRFLSMVNHEVRSPLQNIVTAADFLSTGETQPKRSAAVRRIQHAVIHLQGQLRDLLTIARSSGTALSMASEAFDMAELVRDVCAHLREVAEAKGLAFRLVVPDLPLTVTADPVRIAQVLRNLVDNAVRYTLKGEIEVLVSRHTGESGIQANDLSGVRIQIHDSGPGLPEDALANLQGPLLPFNPSLDGSGIGLLVVSDVLRQLGGRLAVSTTGTDGTTVIVDFFVRDTKDAALDPVGTDGLNILIVDDRADVLEALTEVAHLLGHTCTTATSAHAAEQLLSTEIYDTVLIDLVMPGGMDGLALATQVRSGTGPNAFSMLILISAADNAAVGQAWPFDGFLQKPIDAKTLKYLIGSKTPQ